MRHVSYLNFRRAICVQYLFGLLRLLFSQINFYVEYLVSMYFFFKLSEILLSHSVTIAIISFVCYLLFFFFGLMSVLSLVNALQLLHFIWEKSIQQLNTFNLHTENGLFYQNRKPIKIVFNHQRSNRPMKTALACIFRVYSDPLSLLKPTLFSFTNFCIICDYSHFI